MLHPELVHLSPLLNDFLSERVFSHLVLGNCVHHGDNFVEVSSTDVYQLLERPFDAGGQVSIVVATTVQQFVLQNVNLVRELYVHMILFLLGLLELILQGVHFLLKILVLLGGLLVLAFELFVLVHKNLDVVLSHFQLGLGFTQVLVFRVDFVQHFSSVFVQRGQSLDFVLKALDLISG